MEQTVTTHMNDVDIAKVASLAEKIGKEPHVAETTWRAEVKWHRGFRSEAKVRDFAPSRSDEPEQLGGSNTGPNPVEQLLGALGNCLAVGYAANATVAGIEIKDMTIDVEGKLDLHTFLGLKSDHAGFSEINVRVKLESDADSDALQKLHERVIASSPVGHTLGCAIPLDIRMG